MSKEELKEELEAEEPQHSKFSASSSHRWISCPGSIEAEEGLPEFKSIYAEKGIKLHRLAADVLYNSFNHCKGIVRVLDNWYLKTLTDILETAICNSCYYESSLAPYHDEVKYYIYYILDIVKNFTDSTNIHIEQKVIYNQTAPDGFGTVDAFIGGADEEGKEELHIFDLKTGQVPVYAKNNTQLILYALGVIEGIGTNPDKIVLHIVQPAIFNSNKWELTYEELKNWGDYIGHRAYLASQPNAPRTPSEKACKYCKARTTCPAVYDFTVKSTIQNQRTVISEDDEKFILDNAALITSYVTDIKDKVYKRLLTGESFTGYKLVNGRNMRKLKSDAEVKLVELLGEKAYNRSLLGIVELEKLLGKETLSELVEYEINKPVLAKEDDKREEWFTFFDNLDDLD